MKFVASSRLRLFGALLLAVTLVVAAALTATSRAGSVRTSVVITFSPHVLTVGQQGFLSIKFVNAGPSTVNHVFETVTDTSGNPLPLPASAFSGFTLPTGCSVTGTSTSLITCDLGQVPMGTVRKVISFNASASTAFTARVSASFDEGKQSGLTDTVVDDDFPFSIVSTTDQTRRGQCGPNGSTLLALDSVQQTSITYNALPPSALVPCTPASAGVDSINQPLNVTHPFGEISFVDFLDGAGLATVKVYFFSPPKGITKKNLALYELPSYPLLTATDDGAAVPNCVSVNGGPLQIPPNSHFLSCLVGVDTISGGGLVATLLARGGNDGGWGGAG
jgi:hypothetical protein